jgi:hypothetical protein
MIWDVHPGSRILIFSHPGSWIRILDSEVNKEPELGSRIRIRNIDYNYNQVDGPAPTQMFSW